MSPELIELKTGLSRATAGLDDVMDELMELARGIHPAILSKGGIEPALKTALGGADPARGSGLTGLIDRVEALGGSMTVDGPGRRITAHF